MNAAVLMKHNVLAFPEPPATSVQSPADVVMMINSIDHPDLRSYCVEQIMSAHTLEDVAATVELIREVIRKRA